MSDGIGCLISDVSRLMRRRFDERARAIGVTRAQWRVLVALKRFEGIAQGKLAEHLEVEAITLCRMIDRLEEAGHVERRRDPADRRAWQLYLTPEARPLVEQLRGVADGLTELSLAGLDHAQRTALTDALRTIHANLSHLSSEGHAAHG